MVERFALADGGDQDSDKRENQKQTDALQTDFVRAFPHYARQTFQEFGDGEFGNPEAISQLTKVLHVGASIHLQQSIHNPRSQDQTTADLAMPNILFGEPSDNGIVRAPDQHHMNQPHACAQRYYTQCDYLVFSKQLFIPYVPSG